MAKFAYPEDFEGTFWSVLDGDFYVSTIGNDLSGDGSPQQPFLTVHKAFELSQDGEKIVIGPDEYVGISGTTALEGASGAITPCRLATTTNINLDAGGLLTLDGVGTQGGDRILVWQQINPAENGIYIASGAAPWQRAKDFSNPGNILGGRLVPILEGVQNAKSVFQFTTVDTIELDTTALNFEKFTGGGAGNWGSIQGDINTQTDLTDKINETVDLVKDGVPVEGDTLNKLYQLVQGAVGVSASATDIADRDAKKSGLEDQQNIYVADASGDSTITSGWAIYKYLGSTDSFVKIAEQESLDLNFAAMAGNGLEWKGNQFCIGGALDSSISLAGQGSVSITTGGNINKTAAMISMAAQDLKLAGSNGMIALNGSMSVTDNRPDTAGMEYADDYSIGYTERSLVDKAYVDAATLRSLEILSSQLNRRILKLQFHSDLGTVSPPQLFYGPLLFDDVEEHFKIASYSFEVRKNEPVDWTPVPNIDELELWIEDANAKNSLGLWEMRVIVSYAPGATGEAPMNIHYSPDNNTPGPGPQK